MRAFAIILAPVFLTGCGVTLWSHSWTSQGLCDSLPEVEARSLPDCRQYEYTESYNADGGYAPACGELPPLVGDDC